MGSNLQMYIMPLIMILAIGGYAVFVMTKSKKAIANLGPAIHDFFAKTGYRYANMPPEPIAAHVQFAMQESQNWSAGDRVVHYVRNFHGVPIHFRQAYQTTDRGFSISASWFSPLAGPPRIPFHVADKSLSSVGKAVREAFSNTTRVWNPQHPHLVQTGIPQIDERFVVYGQDPNAVRWLLQQNQALVAALLQCAEVDLWVSAHEAVFADPVQTNMNAAMGGMVGQMAMGFDYGKRLDLSVPVHERMSEILALAVRASA